MKQRTAFTVTLTTSDRVSATQMAKTIREALYGQEIWQGVDGKRKAIGVLKVTVTNIGEK